ncbi:MAG: hypothetical protein V4669_02260 [Pseudomonadota bacterium]
MSKTRWSERLMQVVWPAFIAACLLELVVFAMVDPAEVQWMGRSPGWSRQAVYAGGFFVFWAICAVASTLTAVLGRQESRPAD